MYWYILPYFFGKDNPYAVSGGTQYYNANGSSTRNWNMDALDWEETVTTNEVYTTFLANEIDQYIADYSRENDYFFLQNTLFSEDVVKEGYTVTVYAFVTDKDGNTYHGAPITIDLADLI